MHRSTLFLLPLLVEAFASPVHHAFRIRRDDDVRVNALDVPTVRRDDADLPPLPLEYEEEDDIYMPLDDPRVGSVDADGNVLVPVDDEGRVLPGFEHLVRPIRIEMDANGVPVKKPSVIQGPPPVTNVSEPAVKVEEPPTPSNDSEDAVYDEVGADQQLSQLPALKDYVDSRERSDGSEFTDDGDKSALSPIGSGTGVQVNVTESRSVSPGSNEKDFVDSLRKSTDGAEGKVEEIVDEIFDLARDDLDEKSGSVGQGVVDEKAVEEESKESGSVPNIYEADPEEMLEDIGYTTSKPTVIEESDDDDEADGQTPIEPFAPEFSEGAGNDDSDMGQGPPGVGQGVGETIKALPKDDPRDNSDEFEPEAEKRLDHLRRGDKLGLEAGDRKGKPDAAPLATVSALLVVLVLSMWTA